MWQVLLLEIFTKTYYGNRKESSSICLRKQGRFYEGEIEQRAKRVNWHLVGSEGKKNFFLIEHHVGAWNSYLVDKGIVLQGWSVRYGSVWHRANQ